RLNTGPMWTASAILLPGGRRVITSGWTASVWDLETGEKVQAFRHKGDVNSTTLSPDGKTLLTASVDGTARLWDFESGEAQQIVMRHDEFLYAAAFSHDGRWIAAAGGGRKEGTNFEPGSAHDIHVFQMSTAASDTASAPEAPTESSSSWLWIAALVSLAALSSATLFFVRRRRRLTEAASASEETNAAVETPAAPIFFTCAHCEKRLRVRAELAGKSVKCPKCATATRVPEMADGNVECTS